MNGPSNTHSIDPPTPSKQSESDEIARQTEKYIAEHGPIEESPYEVRTVADLKPTFGHTLSKGTSPGRPKGSKK